MSEKDLINLVEEHLLYGNLNYASRVAAELEDLDTRDRYFELIAQAQEARQEKILLQSDQMIDVMHQQDKSPIKHSHKTATYAM